MSRHEYLTILPVALLAVSCVWAQSTHTPELPAGPMQAKATTACAECHEPRIILQQRLSKTAWTKEVDKMVKWGAVVDPQDRDAFVDYFSTNFGVDQKEYVADRSVGAGGKKTTK
jgi:hypothetical protein